MKVLLVLTAVLAWMQVEGTGHRVCYFTNWSQYRPSHGKYLPRNINATLCTHIAIAFAKMSDTLGPLEWNDESDAHRKGTFEQIVDLKKTNPGLKILLSVGGWNAHSVPFNHVLQSEYKVKMFAMQAARYLRSKNMDGLDVDWEYPTNKEKNNLLIKTLNNAFIDEANKSGRKKLLLTSAVPAGKPNIDLGYDVPFIAKHMDFITVMTYDLHGSWEKVTGHHSAMYAGHWETGKQRYLNVDWIMNYWHQLGVPKSKLNLGVPMYGRCFTLESSSRNNPNDPAKGAGVAGKYTKEGGFLSYYEICEMLKQGAVKKYISDQKVPYFVNGDQWCGFDDISSTKMKVKYVKSKGYGGIAVWSMDLDDFNGYCGQKYPLMTAIFEEMMGNDSSGRPTVASPEREITTRKLTSDAWKDWATTIKPATTRPTKKSAGPCTENKYGVYPDALSCKYFWVCVRGVGAHKINCPPKTLYDESLKTCNHKHLVSCKKYSDPCIGKKSGFMPDPYNCRKFWMCFNGVGYVRQCPAYTLWNQAHSICDWEANVICSPSSEI